MMKHEFEELKKEIFALKNRISYLRRGGSIDDL